MSSRSRFAPRRSLVWLVCAVSPLAAFISACADDDASPPQGSVDGGTLDVAVLEAALADVAVPDAAKTDGAGPETGAIDAGSDATSTDATIDSATDGGSDADAPALTNNATWLASSGLLPSAACAAWTLVDTAAAKDPVLGAGIVTLATDADGENMYYAQGAGVTVTPATLVVEARVKLVSGTSSAAARGPANVTIRYGSGTLRQVAFHIASGEIFLNSSENVKGATASVATTDAAHTYRIEIDTATHATTVFRDSVSTLTATAFVETNGAAERSILFGEASTFAKGSAEWTSVTHNAHALAPCP